MKRNNWLFITIVAVSFLFLFNPFKSCQNPTGTEIYPPASSPKTTEPLKEWVENRPQAPEDYVASLFRDHDVVFLGEQYKIRQFPQFVQALIPALYKSGVHDLGVEYALASDQAAIDSLLTAPSYDEKKAREITFHWVATWGFAEYVDIYKAAWTFNHGLPQDAPPFRIVGLSPFQDWTVVQTDKDLEKTEIIKKVYAAGVPDVFMAETIQKEIVSKGRKAAVYCNVQHAFTRYRSKEYEKNLKDKGMDPTKRTGNIVYDRIGSRAFTAYLHAPWPDKTNQAGMNWAADGAIDTLLSQLKPEKQRFGVSTSGTPFGRLPVKSGSYTYGYDKLTLEDLCDGYVVLGPVPGLEVVTPLPDFITQDNFDQAVKYFPGPKEKDLTLAKYNELIAQDAASFTKALKMLKF